MAEISFFIGVRKGIELRSIERDLEHLASDITVVTRNTRHTLLLCETSKATYESLFQAKLTYSSRMINESVGRPQKVEDWAEESPAKIPDSLKDRIQYVKLNQKVYPCS